jgi:heat shock protein HtpX
MISALRKIEGRGELPDATSAVMEMCIDNPRQGFGELFDTHPSVDSRVAALVKFAGGHDPGPLALPPQESGAGDDQSDQLPPPRGPWGPAVDESSAAQNAAPDSSSDASPGPWGPHSGTTSQSGHN